MSIEENKYIINREELEEELCFSDLYTKAVIVFGSIITGIVLVSAIAIVAAVFSIRDTILLYLALMG